MRESRATYVQQATDIFVQTVGSELTLDDIEAYAKGAEEALREASREMTEHLRDDEGALTSHANHLRKAIAKVVLLRDGLVPSLKIDKEAAHYHEMAVQSMGFIRAEIEAMKAFMR